MFYLPKYQEEIQSKLKTDEILRRLKIAVKHSPLQSQYHEKLASENAEIYLFNGLVSNSGFSISLMLDKPENFFPLVNGQIELADGGSKIHVSYQLFQSVKIFYFFWVFLLSGFAIFSIFKGPHYGWVTLSILMQIGSFLIIQARFREGVMKSRKELVRLLT